MCINWRYFCNFSRKKSDSNTFSTSSWLNPAPLAINSASFFVQLCPKTTRRRYHLMNLSQTYHVVNLLANRYSSSSVATLSDSAIKAQPFGVRTRRISCNPLFPPDQCLIDPTLMTISKEPFWNGKLIASACLKLQLEI